MPFSKRLSSFFKFFPVRHFSSKCKILGIETSCDDTACAIVDADGKILSDCVISQQETVLRNGGIIPPVARELHERNIKTVVNNALQQADLQVNDVDAIAVTVKPGLVMSLLVGMNYAKNLSKTYTKPFIPIHHMEAHALTARLFYKDLQYPFLALLISGGHCILAMVTSVDKFYLLGTSLDDAPGEAFDKIARRLKLHNLPKYKTMSGGAAIEDMAKDGNTLSFDFTQPLAHYRNCDFSFSGFKSRATKYIQCEEDKLGDLEPDAVIPAAHDICASLQYSMTKHICVRLQRAIEYVERKHLLPKQHRALVVSGGAASNSYISRGLEIICSEAGYQLLVPPPKFCTDNGIMIAWNGIEKYKAGMDIITPDEVDRISATPRCPLGEDIRPDLENTAIKCEWIKLKQLHTNAGEDEVVCKAQQ